MYNILQPEENFKNDNFTTDLEYNNFTIDFTVNKSLTEQYTQQISEWILKTEEDFIIKELAKKDKNALIRLQKVIDKVLTKMGKGIKL